MLSTLYLLGDVGSDDLVSILRNAFLKDGGEKKLLTSQVNAELVNEITDILYKRIIFCGIDFQKVDDQKVIKKLVLSIIIPFLSTILELDGDVCWNVFLILYKVLKYKEEILSREEKDDVFFRLCYGRIGLKATIKVPISEEFKVEIRKKGDRRCIERRQSDLCYLLKKLSKERIVNGKYEQTRSLAYFFYLEQLFTKFIEHIIDSNISWLVRDLWPRRIKNLFVNEKEFEQGNHCIGAEQLGKDVVMSALHLNVDVLKLVWTDGKIEEVDIESAVDDHPSTRKKYLTLLLSLLEYYHKKISQDIEMYWSSLVDCISKHEWENEELYPFFLLDIGMLLESLYKENSEAAKELYKELCEKRISKQINCSFFSKQSLVRMKSWSVKDMISKEFLQLCKIESTEAVIEVIKHILPLDCDIDAVCQLLESLQALEDFGSIEWKSIFQENPSIINLTIKHKRSELTHFVVALIDSNTDSNLNNSNTSKFVEWILCNLFSNDIFSPSLALPLLLELKKRSSIKVSLDLLQIILRNTNGDENKSEQVEQIRHCVLELLYSSIFTSNALLLTKTKGENTLKDLFSLLMKISERSACLINLTDGEKYELERKLFLTLTEVLINLDVLTAMECLVCTSNFVDLLKSAIKKKFGITVKALRSLVNLFLHPNLESNLQSIMEYLFNTLFGDDYKDDESLNETSIQVFTILTDSLRNKDSSVVTKYFKDHIYDLVSGFSHKLLAMRKPCRQAAICVANLKPKRKFKLLKELCGIEGSTASTFKEEMVYEEQVSLDIIEMFASIIKEESELPLLTLTKESFIDESNDINAEVIGGNTPLNLTKHNHEIELVLTDSMKKLLNLVLDVSTNPINVLLEGPTGVGKTAVIKEAARLSGKKFIRCNMSSSTSISTIFGSSFPQNKNEKIEVTFIPGPFTEAFCKGYWLLLDEFNLAPDNVLSSIENALDTSVLTLATESAEEGFLFENRKYVEYKKHKNFRLFCTQNPNSGLFKGKREQHSASMLSRFSPVVINPMTDKEIQLILKTKIARNGIIPEMADKYATKMTKTHKEIKTSISKCDLERNQAYNEITVRDALRWVDRSVSALKKNDNKDLANLAWSVYGSRMRERSNRKDIAQIIKNNFGSSELFEKTSIKVEIVCEEASDYLLFNNCKRIYMEKFENKSSFIQAIFSKIVVPLKKSYLMKNQVVNTGHNLYSATQAILNTNKNVPEKLLERYANITRNKSDQDEITSKLTKMLRKVEELNVKDIEKREYYHAEKSITLTMEIKRCWMEISEAINYKQPVLVTGDNGCGKSETIRALGTILQKKMLHLYVTPETEPEALVGYYTPIGKVPVWRDGAVTQAAREGSWLIIENISEAQSVVLERLNSILEKDPTWSLTEKLQDEPEEIKIHKEFRIIATMTPPGGRKHSERLKGANIATNSELSPALYNRFSIVHMENPFESPQCSDILKQIFMVIVGEVFNETDASKFLNVFGTLKEIKSTLNLQHFSRTLESAFILAKENPNIKPTEALYMSIKLHLLCMFNTEKEYENATKTVAEIYKDFKKQYNFEIFLKKFIVELKALSKRSSYLIDKSKSPERYEIACKLALSVQCDFPCLLEGPAATGKSSLVKFVATCFGAKLEQINNTENTTVADYVGSVMPGSADENYVPGPLIRAMENGSFFLADEFDLAEPAVLNILCPLLEGKKSITLPNTTRTVNASPEFRFFATQNGANYAGRKDLPRSLRSRFTEVFFNEFSKKDIEEIILQRTEILSPEVRTNVTKIARKLSEAYEELNAARKDKKPLFPPGIKMTMREIIKWIKRFECFPRSKWGLIGYELLYTKVNDSLMLAEILSKIFSDFPRMQSDTSDPEFNCKPRILVDSEQKEIINHNHLEQDLTLHFRYKNKEFLKMLSNSTDNFKENFWNLSIAAHCKEPILLVGPTSYKSHLISTWCEIQGRDDLEVVLGNPETDTADLLGRLRPYSNLESLNLLCTLCTQFQKLFKKFLAGQKSDFPDYEKYDASIKNIETEFDNLLNSIINLKQLLKEEDVTEEHFEEDNHTDITGNLSSDEVEDDEEDEEQTHFNNWDYGEDDENKDFRYEEDDEMDEESSDIGEDRTDDEIEDSDTVSDNSQISDEEEDVDSNIGDKSLSSDENESKDMSCPLIENFKKTYRHGNKICRLMIDILKMIKNLNEDLVNETNNIRIVCQKFCLVLSEIENNIETQRSTNISFIFQDGPCTRAVKEGSVLILKDVNLPSQAVTERLNTLLDVEPTFSINEDICINKHDSSNEIEKTNNLHIPSSLTMFATVHLNSKSRRDRLNLSPAIRSRMTEINVTEYTNEELAELCELSQCQPFKEIDTLVKEVIDYFKNYTQISITSRDVIRLKTFVTRLVGSRIEKQFIYEIVVLGIIYLWLDQLQLTENKPHYIYIMNKFGFDLEPPKNESKTSERFGYAEDLISAIEGTKIKSIDNLLELVDFEGQKSVRLNGTPFLCSLSVETTAIKQLKNIFISHSAFRNICRVFAAAECGLKLLLNGPPGIGKTKIIEELARSLGYEPLRINCSGNTSYEDLIGTFIPKIVNGKRTFDFVEGPLLNAIKNSERYWILFDEINLAHPVVLQKLMPLFASHKKMRIDATGEVVELKKTHLFATKNPETIGGGRNKIPESVAANFTTIFLSEFNDDELDEIGAEKLGEIKSCAIEEVFNSNILTFHRTVTDFGKNEKIGTKFVNFNLRDLEKFILVAESTSEFHRLSSGNNIDKIGEFNETHKNESHDIKAEAIKACLELIYVKRFTKEEDRLRVRKLIDNLFQINRELTYSSSSIETELKEFIRIGFIYLKKGEVESNLAFPFYLTNQTVENMASVAAALRTGLTVLLQGGNCCGKSSLILKMASLCKRKIINFQMNKDTTTSDLIGSWVVDNNTMIKKKLRSIWKKSVYDLLQLCFETGKSLEVFEEWSAYYQKYRKLLSTDTKNQVSELDVYKTYCKLFRSLKKKLHCNYSEEKALTNLDENCCKIEGLLNHADRNEESFVFVEGPLLEAVRNGHWFLLDNIGQAPGDVMERLNSLSERVSELVLFEGAQYEVLNRENGGIHKDFRLIATYNVDRKGNSPSSALVNRCIVINLQPLDYVGKMEEAKDLKVLGAYEILCQKLSFISRHERVVSILLRFHCYALQLLKEKKIKTINGYKFTIKNLLNAADIIRIESRDNQTHPLRSLTLSINRAYCHSVRQEDKSMLIEKYKILLQQEEQNVENAETEKNIDTGSTNKLVMAFGALISSLLNYFYRALQLTKDVKSTETSKIISNLTKVLQSIFKQNSREINYTSSSNPFDFFENALKWMKLPISVKKMDISGAVSNIKENKFHFSKMLQEFLLSATFADCKRRKALISSIRIHTASVSKSIDLLEEVLRICYAPENVQESTKQLQVLMQELSVIEGYEIYLTRLCNSHYNILLEYIVEDISYMEKNNDRDKLSLYQQMSYDASSLEQIYGLPILSSTDIRQNSIKSILNKISSAKICSKIIATLTKVEFLALEFSAVNKMPLFVLQTPRNMTCFNPSFLVKLNSLFLVKALLHKITTNYPIQWKSSQEKISQIKFNNCGFNEFDMKKLNESIKLIENEWRHKIIEHWLELYNKGKSLDYTEEISDLISSEYFSEKYADVFCLFKVVLEQLSYEQFRIKLSFLEILDESTEYLFDDIQIPFHLILSLDYSIVLLVDRANFSKTDNKKMKILQCSPSSPATNKAVEFIKNMYIDHGFITAVKDLNIKISSSFSLNNTYYLPSYIIKHIYMNKQTNKQLHEVIFTDANLSTLHGETDKYIKETRQLFLDNKTVYKQSMIEIIDEIRNWFEENETGIIYQSDGLRKLEQLKTTVDVEYKEMYNTIRPRNFVEQAQLNILLMSNEKRFSGLEVINHLQNIHSSAEVDIFLAICRINYQYQNSIKRLYKYAMSGKTRKNPFEFSCMSSAMILPLYSNLSANVSQEKNGLPILNAGIVEEVSNFQITYNSFLKKQMCEGCYTDITMDTSGLKPQHSVVGMMLQDFSPIIEGQVVSETDKDKIIADLKELSKKAVQCGFQELLSKIVELIVEISGWKGVKRESNLYREMIVIIKNAEKEIKSYCDAAERDKSLALIFTTKPPEPTDVADKEMEITSIYKDKNPLTEADIKSLKENLCLQLPPKNGEFSIEIFDKLLFNLIKCNTTRISMEYASNLLEDISTEGVEIIDIVAALKRIEKFMDTPECLLCICSIKNPLQSLQKDNVDLEDIKRRIKELTSQISKERVKALKKLSTYSLTDIAEFIDISSRKYAVVVGTLCDRVKALRQSRQILNRYITQCHRFERYYLEMEFVNLHDFWSIITDSKEPSIFLESSLPLNMDELIGNVFKQTMEHQKLQIFSDMSFKLAVITTEKIEKVLKLSKIVKDSSSTPFAIFSCCNLLDLCLEFWTCFPNELKDLLCKNKLKELLDGSLTVKVYSKLLSLKEDYRKLQDEQEQLKAQISEEEHCHDTKRKSTTSFSNALKSYAKGEKKSKNFNFLQDLQTKLINVNENMKSTTDNINIEENTVKNDLKKISVEFTETVKSLSEEISNYYEKILYHLNTLYQSSDSDNRYYTNEDFYHKIRKAMNSPHEKTKCEDLNAFRNVFKSLTVAMNKQAKRHLKEIQQYTAKSSMLYRLVKKFLNLGKCLSESLFRCYDEFCVFAEESEEEKEYFIELQQLKDDLNENESMKHLFQKGKLDDDTTLLVGLKDCQKKLSTIKDFTVEKSTSLRKIQINHLVSYFTKLSLVCIENLFEDKFVEPTMLESLNIVKRPRSQAEKSIIQKGFRRERECLLNSKEGISLFAIDEHLNLEDINVVDSDRNNQDQNISVNVLTLSNFLNSFKKHMDLLLTALTNHVVSEEEKALFNCTVTSYYAFHQLTMGNDGCLNTVENLARAVSLYCQEYKEEDLPCLIELERNFSILKSSVLRHRKGLTRRLKEMTFVVETITEFAVRVLLNSLCFEFQSHLKELVREDDGFVTHKGRLCRKTVVVNFIKKAIKQLVTNSIGAFKDPSIYTDRKSRLENIVLYTANLINKYNGLIHENKDEFINSCVLTDDILTKELLTDTYFLQKVVDGKSSKLKDILRTTFESVKLPIDEIKKANEETKRSIEKLKVMQQKAITHNNESHLKEIEKLNRLQENEYYTQLRMFNDAQKTAQTNATILFQKIIFINYQVRQHGKTKEGEKLAEISSKYYTYMCKLSENLSLPFDREKFNILHSNFCLKLTRLEFPRVWLRGHDDILYLRMTSVGHCSYQKLKHWTSSFIKSRFLGDTCELNEEFQVFESKDSIDIQFEIGWYYLQKKIISFKLNPSCKKNYQSETCIISDAGYNLFYSWSFDVEAVLDSTKIKSEEEVLLTEEDNMNSKDDLYTNSVISNCSQLLRDLYDSLSITPPKKPPTWDYYPQVLSAKSQENPKLSTLANNLNENIDLLLLPKVTKEYEKVIEIMEYSFNMDTFANIITSFIKMKNKYNSLNDLVADAKLEYEQYLRLHLKKGEKIFTYTDFIIDKRSVRCINQTYNDEQYKSIVSTLNHLDSLMAIIKKSRQLSSLYMQLCSCVVSLVDLMPENIDESFQLKHLRNLISRETFQPADKYLMKRKTENKDLEKKLISLNKCQLSPMLLCLDTTKVELEQQRKTTIVLHEIQDGNTYTVNLGDYVRGIPTSMANLPRINFINNGPSLTYDFQSSWSCNIFQVKGDFESKEEKIIYFESLYNDLPPGIQPEEITLTLNYEIPIRVNIILQQSIHEVDPITIIKNSKVIDKEKDIVIDSGYASRGKKIVRKLELVNPLPVPLRLKVVNGEILFKPNEVSLLPLEHKDLQYEFTPEYIGVLCYSSWIYFSSIVCFPIKIKCVVKEPSISISCGEKNKYSRIGKSEYKMTLTILPREPVVFYCLNFFNNGELDLKLSFELPPLKSKRIVDSFANGEKLVDLKAGVEYLPPLTLKATEEDTEHITIVTDVLDNDGNSVKKFTLLITINARYPSMSLSKQTLSFHRLFKKEECKIKFICDNLPLQIYSLKSADISCGLKLPYTVTKKKFDLPINIIPNPNMKEIFFELETNCEKTIQMYKLHISILVPNIMVFPNVIDLSARKESTNLIFRNNTDKNINLDYSLETKHKMDIKIDPCSIRSKSAKETKVTILNFDKYGVIMSFTLDGQEETKIQMPVAKSKDTNSNETMLLNKTLLSQIEVLFKFLSINMKQKNFITFAVTPLVYKTLHYDNILYSNMILQYVLFQKWKELSRMTKALKVNCDMSELDNIHSERKHAILRSAIQQCDNLREYPLKTMLHLAKDCLTDNSSYHIDLIMQMRTHYYSDKFDPFSGTIYPIQMIIRKGIPVLHFFYNMLKKYTPHIDLNNIMLFIESIIAMDNGNFPIILKDDHKDIIDVLEAFKIYDESFHIDGNRVQPATRFIESRGFTKSEKGKDVPEKDKKMLDCVTRDLWRFIESAKPFAKENYEFARNLISQRSTSNDDLSRFDPWFQYMFKDTIIEKKLSDFIQVFRSLDIGNECYEHILNLHEEIICFLSQPEDQSFRNILNFACRVTKNATNEVTLDITKTLDLIEAFIEKAKQSSDKMLTFKIILNFSLELLSVSSKYSSEISDIVLDKAEEIYQVVEKCRDQTGNWKDNCKSAATFLNTTDKCKENLLEILNEYNSLQENMTISKLKGFLKKHSLLHNEAVINIIETFLNVRNVKDSTFRDCYRLLSYVFNKEECKDYAYAMFLSEIAFELYFSEKKSISGKIESAMEFYTCSFEEPINDRILTEVVAKNKQNDETLTCKYKWMQSGLLSYQIYK